MAAPPRFWSQQVGGQHFYFSITLFLLTMRTEGPTPCLLGARLRRRSLPAHPAATFVHDGTNGCHPWLHLREGWRLPPRTHRGHGADRHSEWPRGLESCLSMCLTTITEKEDKVLISSFPNRALVQCYTFGRWEVISPGDKYTPAPYSLWPGLGLKYFSASENL